MALKEYKPGAAFNGVIGRTVDQSEPAWPEPLRAREGAPNVLFIVLDDTGFEQVGCYGSPIKTPNIDSLAANGLLYNSMHTTALCSPTRSCILTGRNHHSNAMSCITEGSTGYPGGNGNISFENGFLSEMLLQQGYNTYAIGKWHLTPADQISAAGPYNRWPLGRGFERYYGFLGGETHQYYPELVYDNHQVEPPKTPEEGYHVTEDLVDKYHVDKDFAENYDITADNRAKLIEMIATWYVEAGKYNVLPVDGRGTLRFAEERPQIAKDRISYTFYPHTLSVPYNAGLRLLNRPHSITTEVEIPEDGAEGVLVSFGGTDGGYSFYVKDGKLQYVQNYVARDYLHVASSEPVPSGRRTLRFEFEATGKPDIANGKGSPGCGQLYIDGKLVGQADFPHTTPLSLGLTGGITVGSDPGAPVAPFYKSPFEFTGTVIRVTFDISGELIRDTEAEMRQIMARQ